MTYLLLNLITASRSILCPLVWFWCWRRRPQRMVLWMVLVFAGFLATDHYDGQWARAYGLESRLGYWLDHVGDVLFYGVVVMSIILGSREPELARRRTKGGAGAPAAPPSALTTSPPPEASAAAARGRRPPS